MQVMHLTADHREEWNDFVAQERSFALLQSWEWGQFKQEMGWKVFRIAARERTRIIAGAQMLIKPLPSRLASIAYIPRGPIGAWLDEKIAIELLMELHRIAQIHKAIFLKIEPPLYYDPAISQTLQKYHFHHNIYTNQPHATIILDLQPNLEEILLQMRKKTRQYIRSAIRDGIFIRIGNQEDLPAYYEMMYRTSQREHFTARTREYYEREWRILSSANHCVLFMAFYENQLLAVRTAHSFGKHAAEFHAGSINLHSNLHPNYLLIWEAIKWARERGCQTYDLWGIPDEVGKAVVEGSTAPITDRTDGLWGVYQFKSGFSKNVKYYTGTYDFVYKPYLYRLITNRFINLETIDRLSAVMDSF